MRQIVLSIKTYLFNSTDACCCKQVTQQIISDLN